MAISSNLKHECQARATLVQHKRDKCDTSATRVRHERHKCDRSMTWVLHERHECDTSENILIFITARVKAYFDIPIFTIWQAKDYKERETFILSITSLPHRNASFPCKNAFERCTTKSELCNGKGYIKKLYARL